MAANNPFPGENNTGHFWDDNLRELANPPPRWWMLAFWASIIWFFVYGILYPFWPLATGYTTGLLGWTQMKEYQEGVAQVEKKREPFENKIQGMTASQIMADSGLTQYTQASAKVLFGDYCSACHGSGGAGNPGYPILADDDWLYGGTAEKLTETIQLGRKGVMIAHKGILTEQEVDTLAKWVVQMSETGGSGGSPEGWNLFKTKGCNACHGPDADGVLARGPNGQVLATVGAANLRDGIWRFAPGGYDSARHTILYGVNQAVEGSREAVMPSFGASGKLDEQEIKKLVVYVHQLGGGQ